MRTSLRGSAAIPLPRWQLVELWGFIVVFVVEAVLRMLHHERAAVLVLLVALALLLHICIWTVLLYRSLRLGRRQ